MTAKVAIRLVLLVVIIIGGCGYIFLSVLQYRIGAQPFDIKVNLQRTGGLFPGSYASYRGVDVGRVSSLDLTSGGVTATVKINPGTRIPTDTQVAVHDLSAVGEQYLDFEPQTSAGPWLKEGSVVNTGAGSLPITIADLLTNIGGFTNSIDTTNFSQLLNTANTALTNSGPQLQRLVSNAQDLAGQLQQSQPAATQLINQGHILLQTAQATNGNVATFSSQLAQLTAQLDSSDASIRQLLANGGAATTQLSSLLQADTPGIQALLGNSATVAGVADNNNGAVQALLSALPITLQSFGTVISGGQLQAHFFLNDSAPVCSYGSAVPEPTSVHPQPTDLDRSCTSNAPDLQQRGSQNAPKA